jgi:tRNA (mo5U34)-methyltransferase
LISRSPGVQRTEELLAELTRRPLAFECARGALQSKVARREKSVYALSPDDIGLFDFAFLGTLLLHLRDPVKALTAVRQVLRPGGRLLVNDEVSLGVTMRHPRRPVHSLTLLPGKPFWWVPNLCGLRRYLEKAGFRIVDSGGPYFLPKGPGYRRPPVPRTMAGLVSRIIHDRGMVHGWVLGDAP